jgi:hypothetical protein
MRSITKTNPADVAARLADRLRNALDENDRLRARIDALETRAEDPEMSYAEAVMGLR